MLPDRRSAPDWVCLGPATSVWVLTSCRKDFTSPGDYEGMFIKAGDSETRKDLALKQQESPSGVAVKLTGESEKRGYWGQSQGVNPGKAAAAH